MLWLLAGVTLSAIVILVVGGLSSSLQVEDPSAAVLAAVGITVLAWLIAGPMGYVDAAIAGVMPGLPNLSRAAALFLTFCTKTVLFSVVTLFVPGITVRGGSGLVLVGAALTVVESLVPLMFMILARLDG